MIKEEMFIKTRKKCYCDTPELIENYDLAISDKENMWHLHHKLEAFFTQSELIKMDKYYHREPRELVFVKDNKEHFSWPHKGRHASRNKGTTGRPAWNKGIPASEEAKRKNAEAHKGNKNMLGKHHSEETRKKLSENMKGHPSPNKGKHKVKIDGKIRYI